MTEAMPKFPVLVVDDSPVYRKLIEHALEDEAYSPLFAKTGARHELYANIGPASWQITANMPRLPGRVRSACGRRANRLPRAQGTWA